MRKSVLEVANAHCSQRSPAYSGIIRPHRFDVCVCVRGLGWKRKNLLITQNLT
jgi:hypothetical protein